MDLTGLTLLLVPTAAGEATPLPVYIKKSGEMVGRRQKGDLPLSCSASRAGTKSLLALWDASRSAGAVESLTVWFSKAGELESVTEPCSAVSGEGGEGEGRAWLASTVNFAEAGSLERALVLRSKGAAVEDDRESEWVQRLLAADVNPHDLQEEVDSLMRVFEGQEAAAAEEAKATEGVPDADGFITVTRKANVVKSFDSKNVKKKRKLMEAGEVGGGGLQLGPFYKFQLRETKRNRAYCPLPIPPPPATKLVCPSPFPQAWRSCGKSSRRTRRASSA